MADNIRLSEETQKQLSSFKIHPRETYEDIIKRAIQGDLKRDNNPPDGFTK